MIDGGSGSKIIKPSNKKASADHWETELIACTTRELLNFLLALPRLACYKRIIPQ